MLFHPTTGGNPRNGCGGYRLQTVGRHREKLGVCSPEKCHLQQDIRLYGGFDAGDGVRSSARWRWDSFHRLSPRYVWLGEQRCR